ncbi:MAG: methyltransferase domain-containing protein [Dehalococcoidia bacterium]
MSDVRDATESAGGNATRDTYTHGHHPSVVRRHQQRTAEKDAAYLLPRLSPGMRLLDVGCGPGTITVGLAAAVAPGEVVGIDVVDEVLTQARAHAAGAARANVRFEQASVYALPYEDATFDAAHAHQVLQHLSRPADALREIRRVLRPGGIIGVRDADYATMSGWPRSPALDRWLDVYHRVATRNGADADAGRRIRSWLREAGFADIELFPTVELYVEAEAADWGNSWAERVLHSSLAEQALAYGVATRDELEAIAAGWRAWARADGALFMFVQIAALARRPA